MSLPQDGPGSGHGNGAAPAARDAQAGGDIRRGAPDPLGRVLDLIRFLRENCPWDAAQTPRSLLPYMLEEAHEVAEAVADGDDSSLAGELGDLLLHLGFQLVLAEERGAFGPDDVVARLETKMRRRHPHLYGDGEAREWEQLKAAERGFQSTLAGLARGLDPLTRAHRLQERASGVGFDWADVSGAVEKVVEELGEVRAALADLARVRSDAPRDAAEPSKPDSPDAAMAALEAELGDLLFAVVNVARLAGVHATTALQTANRKFTERFQALETLARERGVVLGQASLEELDALWDEVKARRDDSTSPSDRTPRNHG